MWELDFPGGTVVENPPANAGNTSSSPGSGKIPHAAEQLSLCTTTIEPALYSPPATTTEGSAPRARALQQEKPPQWEVGAPQRKSSPRSRQLEKAQAQQGRPNAAKNK